MSDFETLFVKATGSATRSGFRPYPYQTRLALEPEWPERVEVPTGMGKTEAVVLAWLWRRRFASQRVRHSTARRLVYCLPMRVLVEQTTARLQMLLDGLGLGSSNGNCRAAGLDGPESCNSCVPVPIHVVMGGEERGEWDADPERDAIIIGTQDMLLSAAMNRGFGTSRYRWPMRFAMLNNDCLWVMDEAQLMGAGLGTSLQLQSFRESLGTWRDCRSIWMSATLDPRALVTVDRPACSEDRILRLNANDMDHPVARVLLGAQKPLRMEKEPDFKKRGAIAETVLSEHRPGTLTLVILNTVKRARDAYGDIRKRACGDLDVRLVHSRFRPFERLSWQREFLSRDAAIPPGGRIVVATQVVEAGVDLSAATLFTDAAPWPSLVQRLGRCNRNGEYSEEPLRARVTIWESKDHKPYQSDDVQAALSSIRELSDGGIRCLSAVPSPSGSRPSGHVIRRHDLLELFDTTADLTGNDLDVQRWIRDGIDADLFIYWRNGSAADGEAPATRDELCPVPVGAARDLLKRQASLELFDPLEGGWRAVRESDLRPGRILRCPASEGGYEESSGFDPKNRLPVAVLPVGETNELDTLGRDLWSQGEWLDIATHTGRVVQATDELIAAIGLPGREADTLRTAARWHDRGKAIPAFQRRLPMESRPPEWRQRVDVAKAPRDAWSVRRGNTVRHELASALAMVQNGLPDLAAYLVAAHHGKVRMALRSLPGEKSRDTGKRVCCGVHDQDDLPQVDLGGGVLAPAVVLDLEPMELGLSRDGHPSWLDRSCRLLEGLGPFKLAYLEMLLRVADWRGSVLDENRE